jgi:sterol-4alpha-carboxylate 3-dehydrogenase (decarboxylating)
MAGGRESYAVIGGEGFVGHALVTALHKRYPQSSILSLDVVQRHYPEKGEWTFRSCDLTDEASLSAALHGVQGVFHTASPHIGGTKELCEKVNVDGTRNIVEVCKKLGVRKLVYTSSAGIPFDCTDLINVDERCTPAPVPIDPYNDTKVCSRS